jgi:hypothetical protein
MYQKVEILSTEKLLNKLKKSSSIGFQVSKRYGILNCTKCIFKHESLIYYFNISDNFDFKKSNGMEEQEFLNEYKNQYWIFEMEL